MPSTFAQISYQDLIDEALAEINQTDSVTDLSPEQMKQFILRGCKKITDMMLITEPRVLRLVNGQKNYDFADTTTPITGVGQVLLGGNKLVSAITSAGTGTISSDGRTITGSGTSFITQLQVGYGIQIGTTILEISSINSPTELVVLVAPTTDFTAQSFVFGQTTFTRTLVSGSTVVMTPTTAGTTLTVTVDSAQDPLNFTITEAQTDAGLHYTYTVNEMVTQIPTRINDIQFDDYIFNGFCLSVKVVDMAYLTRTRVNDSIPYNLLIYPYATFWTPFMCAIDGQTNTKRKLVFYPTPIDNRELTLHGVVKINPSNHTADALTDYCPLSDKYSGALLSYLKYRAYRWLGGKDNIALAQMEYADFMDCMNTLNTEDMNHSYQIVSYF